MRVKMIKKATQFKSWEHFGNCLLLPWERDDHCALWICTDLDW
jgi:hypothetical protein